MISASDPPTLSTHHNVVENHSNTGGVTFVVAFASAGVCVQRVVDVWRVDRRFLQRSSDTFAT